MGVVKGKVVVNSISQILIMMIMMTMIIPNHNCWIRNGWKHNDWKLNNRNLLLMVGVERNGIVMVTILVVVQQKMMLWKPPMKQPPSSLKIPPRLQKRRRKRRKRKPKYPLKNMNPLLRRLQVICGKLNKNKNREKWWNKHIGRGSNAWIGI